MRVGRLVAQMQELDERAAQAMNMIGCMCEMATYMSKDARDTAGYIRNPKSTVDGAFDPGRRPKNQDGGGDGGPDEHDVAPPKPDECNGRATETRMNLDDYRSKCKR